MKNYSLTLLLSLFATSSVFSFSSNLNRSYFDHMYEINKEWNHYKSAAPNEEVQFTNDVDRISAHIGLVEYYLRMNIPAGITGAALENRLTLLSELEMYGKAKVFPTNHYHAERTPYFIDDFGVHCAVGCLIMKSGHSELSNKIKEEHNYDYIRDIKTPGIVRWASEHGFLVEELAWIQPAYQTTQTFSTVGNGTNDEVAIVFKDETNNRLIYAGDFTEIDGGTACPGIGYYQGGQMYCLGNGLFGTINHAYESNGDIIVCGLLSNGGMDYSQAIFSNGSWSYVNIPGMPNAEATTGMSGGVNYKRELVVKNDQGSNEHEIWRLSNSDVWEKQATVEGAVNSIAIGDNDQVYGGMFTTLTLHLSGGDQVLNSTNVCIRENSTENWSSVSGQVADEVYIIKWLNNNFFFGGKHLRIDANYPSHALSMMHADSLLALYGYSMNEAGTGTPISIYDIELVGADSVLAVCGDNFMILDGWLEGGRNACLVDYSNFEASLGVPGGNIGCPRNLGNWQEAINGIAIVNNKLYLGGSLSNYSNLAKMGGYLSLESEGIINVTISPNPASNQIAVNSEAQIEHVDVLDINGRLVSVVSENFQTIDVSSVPPGVYFVKIVHGPNAVSHERIVIQ